MSNKMYIHTLIVLLLLLLLLGMKSVQFHFFVVVSIIIVTIVVVFLFTTCTDTKQQFFIVFICVELTSSEWSICVAFKRGNMRRQTGANARQVSVTYVEI